MSLKALVLAAAAATISLPVWAGDAKIMIHDAYARSGPKSGAAFFEIMNHSDTDDRLIGAASDVAPRVELHTHIETGDGVMQMREIEGGIPVPANGMHVLKRGGDHVMFMGLPKALPQGEEISVTLTFEKAGDITVQIPVDNTRKAEHGHDMKHGHHKHGDHKTDG